MFGKSNLNQQIKLVHPSALFWPVGATSVYITLSTPFWAPLGVASVYIILLQFSCAKNNKK
jgi:hypothetical protein